MTTQSFGSQRLISSGEPTVLALRPEFGTILLPESSTHREIHLSVVDNHFAALLMIPQLQPIAVLVPADATASARIGFIQAVQAWTDIPIIIGLMTDTTDEFVTEAVRLGAKHFVYLPCAFSAITAQVSGRITARNSVLHIGGVDIDESGLMLSASEHRVQLTIQQFAVLYKLAEEYPSVVPLEELCRDSECSVLTLRQVISRIRETVKTGGIPLAVETVRGLGYRLDTID